VITVIVLIIESTASRTLHIEVLEEDLLAFIDVRNLLRAGGRKKTRQSKSEKETHRLLTISSNDGREFTFEIGHSSDSSLVENRYGCDGSQSIAAWCDRFKEQVTMLAQEDRFASVLASCPALAEPTADQPSSGEFSLLAEYCRNANYDSIPSYPRILILPSSFVDLPADILLSAVSQRSRGRMPVLTWMHPKTKAPLCRSRSVQLNSNPNLANPFLPNRNRNPANLCPVSPRYWRRMIAC
jgi:Myotubularin-like phosphatase domain